jgi:hypothetical protein
MIDKYINLSKQSSFQISPTLINNIARFCPILLLFLLLQFILRTIDPVSPYYLDHELPAK